MKTLFQFALVLLLGFMAGTAVAHAPLTEPQKIESLISSIEQLKGAVFIRNGSEYSAAQAAHHLRMKWDYAGKRVATAEQFIDYCASKSSFSGKKYEVRYADGKTVYAADYFHEQLKKISPPAPATAPIASH